MNRIIVGLLAAFMAILLPGCDDESTEIKEVWESYETAREAGNAEGVIAVCDPKNIEHFGELVELAKYADRTTLVRLDPVDRLNVLALRYTKKPDELRAMTGLSMAKEQYSRATGPFGGDFPITLGKISVRPPRAYAEMLVDGETTGLKLEFLKSNDVWRVDLRGEDKIFTWLLEKVAHARNKNLDDLITKLAADMTGNMVSGKVWDAPLKKP
ncbi:MAG: hypothetical protein ACKVW3_09140 [Phycisphaerales bacterium]